MRSSDILRLSAFLALAALTCGREPLDLGPTGSGGAGTAGATGSGGTTGSGGSAGAPTAPLPVPAVHRAAATSCPMMAPTASPLRCAVEEMGPCKSDSDCTDGKDGRCVLSLPIAGCSCTYDQCFEDADCPAGNVCTCGGAYSGNTCVSGSCRVDADCGVGGYCSPVVGGCSSDAMDYACHTPKDTCSDNKDCPFGSSCAPDPSTGVWACGPGNGCPA